MQIVSYGSQDLFLTGTPEITFFKVVYRRYTNFAMENIRFGFDDPVSFGQDSTLTLPKVGDLIHKGYLEILLPAIDFKRNNATTNTLPLLQQAQENYEITQAFMSINRRAYVGVLDLFAATNTTSIEPIVALINEVFDDPINAPAILAFEELITNSQNLFIYSEVSVQSVANSVPLDTPKADLLYLLNIAIDKSIKTQKYFYDLLLDARAVFADESNPNLQFAWVDRVGHAIIEYIEVAIGGQNIDKHYGQWIDIWYELSGNKHLQESYYKLIGNVPVLTTFDRKGKPQYLLRVPLQFWFCQHSGLSIPIVTLEYHDVTFRVKFRDIEDVSYIENGQTIFVSPFEDTIFLDEAPEVLGVQINAWISFDYIFLDTQERRRFAQSSHEYLITQLQIIEIRDVQQNAFTVNLDSLVHPTLELVFVAQKESYTENNTGYTKAQWSNFSLTDAGIGNPIDTASIIFHSDVRTPLISGNYYNYLQPFECHTATPSDGINIYSFSLQPEESQPSGTANMSVLVRVLLILNFVVTDPINIYNITIFARNYNILRAMSGMAATVYTH